MNPRDFDRWEAAEARRKAARWQAANCILTPRMRVTLRAMAAGGDAPIYCGRPTRQRLVKFGLAKYVRNDGDWDGPIAVTDAGRQAVSTE